LEPFVCGALERFGRRLLSRVIPWNLVAVLGGTMTPLKLSISREKLKDIHPADLADLLEDLDRDERRAVVAELGAPAYRADQPARHHFARLSTVPATITDLPAPRSPRLVAALLTALPTPARPL